MEPTISIVALGLSIIATISAIITVFYRRETVRIARYTYLANKWYDIKEKELANPDFRDPSKTSKYSNFFKGDSLSKYETFAWICWGHAEDVYLNKWHEDPSFKPSIKWYKSLHYEWLKEPANRERFNSEFIDYIDHLETNKRKREGKQVMRWFEFTAREIVWFGGVTFASLTVLGTIPILPANVSLQLMIFLYLFLFAMLITWWFDAGRMLPPKRR